jgi:sialate O-acetylesterase
LKNFSEVAYFFAKKLNQKLNVPIGLIESSWGGTPAEVWTPAEAVNDDIVLKESAHKIEAYDWWPYWPGYAYNGMIYPLKNYNISGAIWYQGEGNTSAPGTYAKLLTTMIKSWRNAWQKDFPFYFVQIAPFTYGDNYVGAVLREQQEKVLALEKTGMVVTTDITADTTNIHPPDKHDVGYRLANLALAEAYNQNIKNYKSPLFKSMTVENNKAIIDFYDADDGLTIKGDHIAQLYIAGSDSVFYPADAKIQNDKLIVSSKNVDVPVSVRYEFSNAGIGNLFSISDLPVAPFRTDNWEVLKKK